MCDNKSNVNPIFYRFRDIHSQIVHELNLDLWKGQKSNEEMPIQSHFLFVAIGNVRPFCHRFRYIRDRDVHDHDLII